ncbi:hypothetical protein [Streptomyces sp. NPDC088135]|uniref:hypothetical protein n=1 Tax=Streptomyces sp. NPDC088135 TaxID=3160993 RepID=UPI00342C4D67
MNYERDLKQSVALGTAWPCHCGDSNPPGYDACHTCQTPSWDSVCRRCHIGRGEDVTATVYGVHILSFEDGDAALTHDRRLAIAALNAFHRTECGERLGDISPALALSTGWVRYDPRPDGTWVIPTTADHPAARPVTWLIP